VAVVLAAGRSRRLEAATGGASKALLPVGGLALLERTVRGLLAAGLERVVVVVGHDGENVGRLAARLAPGRVEVVRAGHWSAGNGCSLAAAADTVASEPLFVVTTGDHLFGPAALAELLDAGEPAVLVDPAPSPAVVAEGTRVVAVDGRAVAFGKDLAAPAVDCGAFVLPPEVFGQQRLAAGEGDYGLAGAISRLAREQPLRVVPLRRATWWQDVDTPADLQAARRLLRRSLPKPSDGPVSRWLNRPVSTRISMALAGLRPSPDLVTLLVFLLTLGGAASLAAGAGLLGAVLVQLSSMLDGVDGELARLLMRGSPRGALLDSVLDRVGDGAVLLGAGLWALALHVPAPAVLVLTAAAITGAFLSMAVKDRAAALGRPFPERLLGWLLGGRDGRLLLVAVCAVLGQPLVALAAVAATSGLAAAGRLAVAWRWMEADGEGRRPA
jgi:1L-myo-inositol 1-phosphate cytidylyltransferase / CDP-L-myo-inositol myo-inositolphosphotransferase